MQARNISLITKVNVPVVVETPSIWEILNAIRTGQPLLDQYPFIGTVKKIRTLLNAVSYTTKR